VAVVAVVAIALFVAAAAVLLIVRRGSRRPNVLLVSIDTLRADRLGCYGRKGASTPTMDRLAAEGVLFEHASSAVPITLASHATLLTGLLPDRHGVRDNGSFRLPATIRTLAETFHDAGYRTGAVIGAAPLERSGGLARGFDTYDDRLPSMGFGGEASRAERDGSAVVAAARAWAEEAEPGRPDFLFVHFYDPHSPYQQALAPGSPPTYEGEVAYVDRRLGELLADLERREGWRDALVVVTADHGESLGEHGEATHCIFVYESTLHVPLLARWRGRLAPARVPGPVSLADVAPTVAALAGLPPLGPVDGVDLLPGRVPRAGADRQIRFESQFGALRFGWAPLAGVRRGRWKYVDAPRPELYDLDADPGETTDRIAEAPGPAAELARLLKARSVTTPDAAAAPSQEAQQALRALGYLSGPTTRPLASPADPKDRIAAYERFQDAHVELLAGRHARALELMREIEPELGGSFYYHLELGNLASGAGEWSLAARAFERCLSFAPANLDALRNAAVAHLKLGEREAAVSRLQALVTLRPGDAEAHLYLGVALQELGRDPSAAFRRFLELAPTHPQAAQVRAALGGRR